MTLLFRNLELHLSPSLSDFERFYTSAAEERRERMLKLVYEGAKVRRFGTGEHGESADEAETIKRPSLRVE